MNRAGMFVRMACCLVVTASWAQAADAPPLDGLGDPLPEGAVARIGTIRLRHPGPIHSLAFSPDDRLLASAGQDAAVRLWDAATGKLSHLCRGEGGLDANDRLLGRQQTVAQHGRPRPRGFVGHGDWPTGADP